MKRSYLVAALFAVFTLNSNLQAELITINIGPTGFNIGGINAGLADGGAATASNFPISGDSLSLRKTYFSTVTGLRGSGLAFATGNTLASPVNFALNALIGSGSTYTSTAQSYFMESPTVSPVFGPGSYMGFRTSQNNYGWLEVTWDGTNFEILSGAYESRPDVAILAGGAAPIPEPGTWAAMAIFAGGAAYSGWRRRKSAKVA